MKTINLNDDEIDMISEFCRLQIKKAQNSKARVESIEFLNAGARKAMNMNNQGLVDHLYAQTAVELLQKLGES